MMPWLLYCPIALLSLVLFAPSLSCASPLDYSLSQKEILELPPSFPHLTVGEEALPWAQEYRIGRSLAQEGDFYRAITAFKRARYLLPYDGDKKTAIQYSIMLSYFLGGKYGRVIEASQNAFFNSESLPLYLQPDLCSILYWSNLKEGEEGRAESLIEEMAQIDPERADWLWSSAHLSLGKGGGKNGLPPLTSAAWNHYLVHKKSAKKAACLNLLMPGAGYLYLGQRQSALTAALLNGLTVAASYYFFHRGRNIPAGILMSSLEMGWYAGGVYGAIEQTGVYNEVLYERSLGRPMYQEKLFPLMQIQHGF
ncbi:MAG: hypothetical protein VXZ72_04050 [Chlamydiota bacterium]|nr:hypothetical protein [Chlamydiota bacterium]